jgi:hypothetical protein
MNLFKAVYLGNLPVIYPTIHNFQISLLLPKSLSNRGQDATLL